MYFFILFFFVMIVIYIVYRRYKIKQAKQTSRKVETALNEKEADFSRINEWITLDKKYLDPDLKLDKVARGVHLSEKQVSTAINTIACQNFNSYINKLRIKEAQQLLLSPNHSHYTVDAMAEMVGFSNKVSFYKSFKKVTGKSPTDFKKASNQPQD